VHLFDEAIGYPLATTGWDDAPHRFTVHAEATSGNNLGSLLGMHINLDAQWEPNGQR
jgi:hypothetical protein